MTGETVAAQPAARPGGVRLLPSEGVEGKPVSLWRTAWRRLFQRRSAVVGLAILGLLIGFAILAPWIAPYDPQEVLIGKEDVGPRDPPCIHLLGCPADQPQHLMGIDSNVRDLFSRVVYGARYSLVIGFASVTFAILIGTVLGALAGQAGGGDPQGPDHDQRSHRVRQADSKQDREGVGPQGTRGRDVV